MTRPLLILRPEPGASTTAGRARDRGLCPVMAPLFTVAPVAWAAPDPAGFDAVLLTSANALRHGGPELARLTTLPAFAVGAATAAAARRAGFVDAIAGTGDAEAIVAQAAAAGARRLLHLAGREHRAVAVPGVTITRCIAYAAIPEPRLPDAARAAIAAGPVALLHSPRAAALFRRLVDDAAADRSAIRIAAISPAARESAGTGWQDAAVAPAPRDEALLAVAARLCD